jgi:hypothetical protein
VPRLLHQSQFRVPLNARRSRGSEAGHRGSRKLCQNWFALSGINHGRPMVCYCAHGPSCGPNLIGATSPTDIVWRATQDSNLRPSAPEADALSS